MPRVLITSNVAKVLPGIKTRRVRVQAAVAVGAMEIAAFTNATIIPEFYPGKVASALAAIAEPYVTGGTQMAVRVRRLNRLFNFYEYGTKLHPEGMNGPMAFMWEKAWATNNFLPDGRSIFAWVTNPGYAGRNKLPQLRAAMYAEAKGIWSEAIAGALQL